MAHDTPQGKPFFTQRSTLNLANYHQQDGTGRGDSATSCGVRMNPRIPAARGVAVAHRPLVAGGPPPSRRCTPLNCADAIPRRAHGTHRRARTRTRSLCGDSPRRLYRCRKNGYTDVSFRIIRHTVPMWETFSRTHAIESGQYGNNRTGTPAVTLEGFVCRIGAQGVEIPGLAGTGAVNRPVTYGTDDVAAPVAVLTVDK